MKSKSMFLESAAILSDCGRYRYSLRRIWDDDKPTVCFIMLNPSTADATEDDPTIRRCMNFAEAWGYGGIRVVNLFALRATSPREIYKAEQPIGETEASNDNVISANVHFAGLVVAAWGVHGSHMDRGKKVLQMLKTGGVTVQCLGQTKDGHPKHPLYLAADTTPYQYLKGPSDVPGTV